MRSHTCADVLIWLRSQRLGVCHMPSPSELFIATPRSADLRDYASPIIYSSIVIPSISIYRVSDKHWQRNDTQEGRIFFDPGLGVQESGER